MLLFVGAVVGTPSGNGLLAASLVITEPGDYSDNETSPTVITSTLELGTNIVHGSVEGNLWFFDLDYIRVTLPPSSRLSAVMLTVSGYENPESTRGSFAVLPAVDGNSGSFQIDQNTVQSIAFNVGNHTNITLYASAPVTRYLGQETFFNYHVQLIVERVVILEPVDGIALRKAVEVTFPSTAGLNYQVQCTSDLGSDTWVDLGSPMAGEDGSLSSFDTTATANQRFYRIVAQPIVESPEVLEPSVAPELVDGTAIRTAVGVSFASEAGRIYQLQCTSEPSSASWINVGSPMVGAGGSMVAFDSVRPGEQPVYRVMRQQ